MQKSSTPTKNLSLDLLRFASQSYKSNPQLLIEIFKHMSLRHQDGPMLALLHVMKLTLFEHEFPFLDDVKHVQNHALYVKTYNNLNLAYERSDIHLRALLGDAENEQELSMLIDSTERDGIDDFREGCTKEGLLPRQYLAIFHPHLLQAYKDRPFDDDENCKHRICAHSGSGLFDVLTHTHPWGHLWIQNLTGHLWDNPQADKAEYFPSTRALLQHHPRLQNSAPIDSHLRSHSMHVFSHPNGEILTPYLKRQGPHHINMQYFKSNYNLQLLMHMLIQEEYTHKQIDPTSTTSFLYPIDYIAKLMAYNDMYDTGTHRVHMLADSRIGQVLRQWLYPSDELDLIQPLITRIYQKMLFSRSALPVKLGDIANNIQDAISFQNLTIDSRTLHQHISQAIPRAIAKNISIKLDPETMAPLEFNESSIKPLALDLPQLNQLLQFKLSNAALLAVYAIKHSLLENNLDYIPPACPEIEHPTGASLIPWANISLLNHDQTRLLAQHYQQRPTEVDLRHIYIKNLYSDVMKKCLPTLIEQTTPHQAPMNHQQLYIELMMTHGIMPDTAALYLTALYPEEDFSAGYFYLNKIKECPDAPIQLLNVIFTGDPKKTVNYKDGHVLLQQLNHAYLNCKNATDLERFASLAQIVFNTEIRISNTASQKIPSVLHIFKLLHHYLSDLASQTKPTYKSRLLTNFMNCTQHEAPSTLSQSELIPKIKDIVRLFSYANSFGINPDSYHQFMPLKMIIDIAKAFTTHHIVDINQYLNYTTVRMQDPTLTASEIQDLLSPVELFRDTQNLATPMSQFEYMLFKTMTYATSACPLPAALTERASTSNNISKQTIRNYFTAINHYPTPFDSLPDHIQHLKESLICHYPHLALENRLQVFSGIPIDELLLYPIELLQEQSNLLVVHTHSKAHHIGQPHIQDTPISPIHLKRILSLPNLQIDNELISHYQHSFLTRLRLHVKLNLQDIQPHHSKMAKIALLLKSYLFAFFTSLSPSHPQHMQHQNPPQSAHDMNSPTTIAATKIMQEPSSDYTPVPLEVGINKR